MRNVTYLRVIAGDQSRIIDYSHVVKKVDDRYQSLSARKSQENLSGLTSMTQAATLKIAADAPIILALAAMKGRLSTNPAKPPIKKTSKYLPETMLFCKVPPKTNRKIILPIR